MSLEQSSHLLKRPIRNGPSWEYFHRSWSEWLFLHPFPIVPGWSECQRFFFINSMNLYNYHEQLRSTDLQYLKKSYWYFIFRRLTLNDAIEKSLKKGRGNEQAAAAQLAVLLVIQLGPGDFVDEICQCLVPTLLSILGDTSMACAARAKVNIQRSSYASRKYIVILCAEYYLCDNFVSRLFQCCWALSLLAFIGNYDNVDEVMDTLRQSFRTAVNSNVSGDESLLHTSAISAWCLLLTVASSTNSFVM